MSEVAHTPQLRFPEFSGAWNTHSIGKIGTFFSGGTPASSNKDYYSGTIPFIGSGKISSESVKQHITQEALDSSSAKIVNEGDLLYALYGATSGAVALSKINGAINQAVLCIRTNENKFFLKTWLEKNKERILGTYLQGGQGNLSAQIVKSLKLNLPTKPEQQKIAAFLTVVDNKIEQLSKKQALLGEYKKGLMQKIFSQAIRFKADDGSDFPDWEDGLLNTLIDNSRKIRYGIVQPGKYDKNGKYLIRGKDYSNGWEIPSEFFKVSDAIEKKYSKTRVKKGDVIVCIVGSVGNVMVIPGWLDGANITQTTARIAPDKNKLNNQYLYFYFQSLVGRNMIHKHTRVGTRPGLNIEDVEKFSILLPSLLEQAKIANFLSSIDNKIEQVGKQLDESKQFKKALLQQMFV